MMLIMMLGRWWDAQLAECRWRRWYDALLVANAGYSDRVCHGRLMTVAVWYNNITQYTQFIHVTILSAMLIRRLFLWWTILLDIGGVFLSVHTVSVFSCCLFLSLWRINVFINTKVSNALQYRNEQRAKKCFK